MKIGIEFRYINSPSPQKLPNSSRSPPPQPILGHLGGNRANFPPLTSLKTRSGVTKDENWWKTPNPKILCFSNWFTSPNRLETLITSSGTVLKTSLKYETWVAVRQSFGNYSCCFESNWAPWRETWQIISTQTSHQAISIKKSLGASTFT